MRLSKYEKETIVLYNQTADPVTIYTFDAKLKKRLSVFAGKYPELCRLEETTKEGSVTYSIEKSRVSIRLLAPYSEERRKAASEFAKTNGFKEK